MLNSIRNIGILAHVDAGKTTLTERLLLLTHAITRAGRVDAGTAHTDDLPIERARGISIRARTACIRHRGIDIRIIDTPGHIDFSLEVEHALLALDGVVLVLSAVEGVQPQTVVIDRVLAQMGIPLIAFINKTDRAGADVPRVLKEMRSLSVAPLPMFAGHDDILDALTLGDEALLEEALNGGATAERITRAAAEACAARRYMPVLTGAALKGEGVEALLDGIAAWLPPPQAMEAASLVAYHVERIDGERQVHVRLYGGGIGFGDDCGCGRIKRMRAFTHEGIKDVKTLRAGDIGVLVGPDALGVGQWIGAQARGRPTMSAPIFRARVEPEDEAHIVKLLAALSDMQDEQPGLEPAFEPLTRQIWVHTRGDIHAQVIEQTLRDVSGIPARLCEPGVLLRERPAGVGEGRLDMFFSPWYARAAFRVEPGAPGSGVVFNSLVSTDILYLRYLRDIEETVREALRQGLRGWPVTDIAVTLTDGQCIRISHPGSRFGPVVPLGLFEALNNAGTRLLEPMSAFETRVDAQCAGRVLYDMECRAAAVNPPVYEGDTCVITGRAPVRTSHDYGIVLREISHGMGSWVTWFDGYAACPDGYEAAIPRSTPDPLNKELFMKYVRGVVGK